MVHISRKYLEENLKRTIINQLIKEVRGVESQEQLSRFLNKLFTPSEIVMLEKRLAIMHLIRSELKYQEIARMIDVSSSTISFVKSGFTKKPTVKKQYSPMPRSRTLKKNVFSRFPSYKGTGQGRFEKNRKRFN